MTLEEEAKDELIKVLYSQVVDATTSVKMGRRMGVQVYDVQVQVLS